MPARTTALLLTATLTAALTAACTSSSAAPRGSVSVVASTDVWGNVAAQVAGRTLGHRVSVTSVIANPDADPHSYEANVRNQLAISRAGLVVENGGGYDDFMGRMRRAGHSHAPVIDAVRISGKQRPGAELNEHVWYDIPTVVRVAERIRDALSAKDSRDAGAFAANTRAFVAQLRTLQGTEAHIAAGASGRTVAITEPVPLYLTAACGLRTVTPPAFSKAVEDGTDVAPSVLHTTLRLFADRRVDVLVYNAQTSGPETTLVRDAAKAASIPEVAVTETLPAHLDYVGWMRGILARIERSLS